MHPDDTDEDSEIFKKHRKTASSYSQHLAASDGHETSLTKCLYFQLGDVDRHQDELPQSFPLSNCPAIPSTSFNPAIPSTSINVHPTADGNRALLVAQSESGKAPHRRFIKPPKYDNRFTRMILNKDNVFRTNRGFVEFFNINSAYMLDKAWEKVITPKTRTEERRITDTSNTSLYLVPSSTSDDVECLGSFENVPNIIDNITIADEKGKDSSCNLNLHPFSDKKRNRGGSVQDEDEIMCNFRDPRITGNRDVSSVRTSRETDASYDPKLQKRCRMFLAHKSCKKGGYCEFLHSFPKDENILCKRFEMGACRRSQEDCWFKHNEKRNHLYERRGENDSGICSEEHEEQAPTESFDKNWKDRCKTFIKQRHCTNGIDCRFIHSLPKDDGVLCKFFVAGHCGKSAEMCIFKHELVVDAYRKGSVVLSPIRAEETCKENEMEKFESRSNICTSQIEKQQDLTGEDHGGPEMEQAVTGSFDKDLRNRCKTFLKHGECKKGNDCKYIHILPKDDNVLCKFFLAGDCAKNAEICTYKHDKDVNASKNNSRDDFNVIGTKENCEENKRHQNSGGLKVTTNIEDVNIKKRCKTFLKKRQCPRGNECKYLHTLPKDDNVSCKRFLTGNCMNSVEVCNFKHDIDIDASAIDPDGKDNREDSSPVIAEEHSDTVHSLGLVLKHLKTKECRGSKVIRIVNEAPVKDCVQLQIKNSSKNPVVAKAPTPEKLCFDRNHSSKSPAMAKSPTPEDVCIDKIESNLQEGNMPKSPVMAKTRTPEKRCIGKNEGMLRKENLSKSPVMAKTQTSEKHCIGKNEVMLQKENLSKSPVMASAPTPEKQSIDMNEVMLGKENVPKSPVMAKAPTPEKQCIDKNESYLPKGGKVNQNTGEYPVREFGTTCAKLRKEHLSKSPVIVKMEPEKQHIVKNEAHLHKRSKINQISGEAHVLDFDKECTNLQKEYLSKSPVVTKAPTPENQYIDKNEVSPPLLISLDGSDDTLPHDDDDDDDSSLPSLLPRNVNDDISEADSTIEILKHEVQSDIDNSSTKSQCTEDVVWPMKTVFEEESQQKQIFSPVKSVCSKNDQPCGSPSKVIGKDYENYIIDIKKENAYVCKVDAINDRGLSLRESSSEEVDSNKESSGIKKDNGKEKHPKKRKSLSPGTDCEKESISSKKQRSSSTKKGHIVRKSSSVKLSLFIEESSPSKMKSSSSYRIDTFKRMNSPMSSSSSTLDGFEEKSTHERENCLSSQTDCAKEKNSSVKQSSLSSKLDSTKEKSLFKKQSTASNKLGVIGTEKRHSLKKNCSLVKRTGNITEKSHSKHKESSNKKDGSPNVNNKVNSCKEIKLSKKHRLFGDKPESMSSLNVKDGNSVAKQSSSNRISSKSSSIIDGSPVAKQSSSNKISSKSSSDIINRSPVAKQSSSNKSSSKSSSNVTEGSSVVRQSSSTKISGKSSSSVIDGSSDVRLSSSKKIKKCKEIGSTEKRSSSKKRKSGDVESSSVTRTDVHILKKRKDSKPSELVSVTFPISSQTSWKDLFYLVAKLCPSFEGEPQKEDIEELYLSFAETFRKFTQWELLESDESDRFIVLEANLRIFLAFVYVDEKEASRIRNSLIEHWQMEPDLRKYKSRLQTEKAQR